MMRGQQRATARRDSGLSAENNMEGNSSPVSSEKNAASAVSSPKDDDFPHCFNCQRRGMRNCSQHACLKCCADEECEGHRVGRAIAKKTKEKNNAILDGTSWVNLEATRKRALGVTPRMFRENAFQYLGETVEIWDIRQFFAVPKWTEDALRRSRRNHERTDRTRVGSKTENGKRSATNSPMKESRKKRFRRVFDELYKKKNLESHEVSKHTL